MTISLHHTAFEEKPLRPFGTELIPENGSPVDVRSWVSGNVNEVSEYVRNKGLVVVSHAVQERVNANREDMLANAWADFPQVDCSSETRGPSDGLVFIPPERAASAAAFVRGSALRRAMHENRSVLTTLDTSRMYPGYRGMVENVQRCLTEENPDILPVQRVLPALVQLRQGRPITGVEAMPQTPWRAFTNFLLGLSDRSQDDIDHEGRSLRGCENMVREFREAVVSALASDVYVHDWKKQPSSAVLAWNNPTRSSASNNDFVAHYAVTAVTTPTTSNPSIIRIHKDKLLIS